MKLRGINIPTPNAKRLADFYKNVLGAAIDETHGGPERIEIRFENNSGAENGGGTFFLAASQDTGYQKAKTTACRGFEFQVPDVDAEYNRIRALGIEIKQPPKDLPWGFRYFSIADPDGNSIDIVQAL